MDLTIAVEDTTLNVRVAGLVRTARGYLFEKHIRGYFFPIGGRVKVGESSREAMVRETMEEIGMKAENLTLHSVIENFYSTEDKGKVQEICYVYTVEDIFTGELPAGIIEVPLEDIDQYDIKPASVVTLLKNKNEAFQHIIVKE